MEDREIVVLEFTVPETVVGEIVLSLNGTLEEHLTEVVDETLRVTLQKPVASAVEAVLKAHGTDAEFVDEVVDYLVGNFTDQAYDEIVQLAGEATGIIEDALREVAENAPA